MVCRGLGENQPTDVDQAKTAGIPESLGNEFSKRHPWSAGNAAIESICVAGGDASVHAAGPR